MHVRIKEEDEDDVIAIAKLQDYVVFRNHICLAFNKYDQNLYDLIKKNQFMSLPNEMIKRMGIQVLMALHFLKKRQIIHCDIKPENIMMLHSNRSAVRIIDFGSSCFDTEKLYSYIQSRYYRAPEVILGITYSFPIDMWSLACVLAELHTGFPIFQGDTE